MAVIASVGGMRMMKKHGFVGSSRGCFLLSHETWGLGFGVEELSF